jgi:mycothiol synthase
MKRSLADLPPLVVPNGYDLRHFERGDEDAWAALMARNAELGDWDRSKAEPYFAHDSRMHLEGAFFVTSNGTPVATAQLHLKPEGQYAPIPELGWVAVDPAHKGRALASVASLAVMHYAASQDHREIFLLTDDWRLPAVWTYLKLGFEPWITDASHPERWTKVQTALEEYRSGRASPVSGRSLPAAPHHVE